MSKPSPGLRKRGNIWHIEKIIFGIRVFESTGETQLDYAERYLARRVDEIRRTHVYGEKISHTFDQAAARYIEDYAEKRSLDRDIICLKHVMPYIGNLPLESVHIGALTPYIQERQAAGIKAGTINRDLAIVSRILHLATRLWRDDRGRPWLDNAPLLPHLKGPKRKPRPITWEEQARLFKELPEYLAELALFAVNTGLRDQEICRLRWEWEYSVTGMDAMVFIIPDASSKNGRERLVPLNAVARSIIEGRRGKHPEWVFALKGKPIDGMTNRAWLKARKSAGLEEVRVHDLRHTFGMRLRAVGVGLEDRQDLLGHYAGRMTTHYSKAEILNLIECVEKLCSSREKPEITLIRRVS